MKKFEKKLPINTKDFIHFGETVLFDVALFLEILYEEFSKTHSKTQLKEIMNLKNKLFINRHKDIKKYILNHDLLQFSRKLKKWLSNTKTEKFVGKYMRQGYSKKIKAIIANNDYERSIFGEYTQGNFEQFHYENKYDFDMAKTANDIKKTIWIKRGYYEVDTGVYYPDFWEDSSIDWYKLYY